MSRFSSRQIECLLILATGHESMVIVAYYPFFFYYHLLVPNYYPINRGIENLQVQPGEMLLSEDAMSISGGFSAACKISRYT